MKVRVIGVGNRWRSDDAVGLVVAERLRGRIPGVEVLEREGEPVALLEAWQDEEAVVLVDAVSSGAPPGTVHTLDATREPLPASFFRRSTHHLGVADAVELARAIGSLPPRTVVVGVEGARWEPGTELTPAVADAVDAAADAVAEEVARCTSTR